MTRSRHSLGRPSLAALLVRVWTTRGAKGAVAALLGPPIGLLYAVAPDSRLARLAAR